MSSPNVSLSKEKMEKKNTRAAVKEKLAGKSKYGASGKVERKAKKKSQGLLEVKLVDDNNITNTRSESHLAELEKESEKKGLYKMESSESESLSEDSVVAGVSTKPSGNVTPSREHEDEFLERIMRAVNKTVASSIDAAFTRMENSLGAKFETIEKKTTDLEERMKALEEKSEKLDQIDEINKKLEDYEAKLDELEQSYRAPNMIVMGLREVDNPAREASEIIQKKLKITFQAKDLHYWIPMTRMRGEEVQHGVKLVFKEYALRNEIYRARTALKGTKVYLNDDLTQARGLLAYKAREAVRANKIHLTWTFDGKIFVKDSAESKPRRVKNEADILDYN